MKSRQDYIIAKAKISKQKATKKLFAHINTGLALMAAGAIMGYASQVEEQATIVQAQNRTSPSDFLNLISGYARDIAAENDLYASVMIAQAALESGWGNSTLAQAPNYNLFGIKGQYNGNSVNKDTLEDNGSGQYYQIQDDFRVYDNYGQSLSDYANLLTGNNDPSNWRYNFYAGARRSNANSYQDATSHLTGTYATDTQYGAKLNNIITQNNLTQFDVQGGSSSGSVNAGNGTGSSNNSSQTPPQSAGTYRVKSGDGLYRIAVNHGMTLAQLKALNGISSNLIYPGQVLKVAGNVSGTPSTDSGSNNESNNNESNKPTNPAVNLPGNTSGSYTIQRGDSLYAIARKYNMSASQLKATNNLTSDTIHPGQVLSVNGTGGSASTGNTTTPNNNNNTESGSSNNNQNVSGSGRYTVKSGDGLYRIAVNHGMSLSQLKTLNGLSGDLIHPGQTLIVSGPASNTTHRESNSVTTEETNTDTAPVVSNSNYSNVSASGTYTVKSGDGLYRIAVNHGMSLSQLKALNGLSSDAIYPGQSLKVSGSVANTTVTTNPPTNAATTQSYESAAVETTTVEQTAPETSTSTGGAYTVQAGDTLFSIASRHGLNVNQLVALNNGSTLIHVGQTLSLN